MDTSNQPGNETLVAGYAKALLESEGIHKIAAAFALNEGGDIHITNGKVDIVQITIA